MAFSDLVQSMDSAILSSLSDGLRVTLHFKDGSPDVTVDAITKNPTLESDYVPGSAQGTGTLLLFARYDVAFGALHGCTATVSGVDYDVQSGPPDMEGGVTLKLRRRNQRWDQ